MIKGTQGVRADMLFFQGQEMGFFLYENKKEETVFAVFQIKNLKELPGSDLEEQHIAG